MLVPCSSGIFLFQQCCVQARTAQLNKAIGGLTCDSTIYLCSLDFVPGTRNSHASFSKMLKVQNDFRLSTTTVTVKPEKVIFALFREDMLLLQLALRLPKPAKSE